MNKKLPPAQPKRKRTKSIPASKRIARASVQFAAAARRDHHDTTATLLSRACSALAVIALRRERGEADPCDAAELLAAIHPLERAVRVRRAAEGCTPMVPPVERLDQPERAKRLLDAAQETINAIPANASEAVRLAAAAIVLDAARWATALNTDELSVWAGVDTFKSREMEKWIAARQRQRRGLAPYGLAVEALKVVGYAAGDHNKCNGFVRAANAKRLQEDDSIESV